MRLAALLAVLGLGLAACGPVGLAADLAVGAGQAALGVADAAL